MKTLAKPEQKTPKENLPVGQAGTTVEYTNAFVLKGKELKPFTTDANTAAKIAEEKKSLKKNFKNENELAEIVLSNGKILFGEKTILIDCLKKNRIQCGFVPDAMLFDLREKPRFYFVEMMLSNENLAELFLRITKLFSFFKTPENIRQFTITLYDAISKNIGWRNKLKNAYGEKGGFLEEMLAKQPSILLVMDAPIPELTGFTETYTETWGKFVKPMLLRKFAINGDTVITIVPTFSELSKKLNGKKNGKLEKEKSTEEDHFENVSETVKEIFLHIKSELLKADSEIEFRVKKFYISLRKKRNLAFFQLGKKKLSIVLANPEKNMQKQIKHHEIRTLAESVKKFWNGNEHCFTVVVENKEHLSEITQLLKKLIANGANKEEASDETAPETPKNAHSEEKKAKTGKTSPQEKPKRKNGKKR